MTFHLDLVELLVGDQCKAARVQEGRRKEEEEGNGEREGAGNAVEKTEIGF